MKTHRISLSFLPEEITSKHLDDHHRMVRVTARVALHIFCTKSTYRINHLTCISGILCKYLQTRNTFIIGTDKILWDHTHPGSKIMENSCIGMRKSVITFIPEREWDRYYCIWMCRIRIRLKEVSTEPTSLSRMDTSNQTNVHDKPQTTNIFWF